MGGVCGLSPDLLLCSLNMSVAKSVAICKGDVLERFCKS